MRSFYWFFENDVVHWNVSSTKKLQKSHTYFSIWKHEVWHTFWWFEIIFCWHPTRLRKELNQNRITCSHLLNLIWNFSLNLCGWIRASTSIGAPNVHRTLLKAHLSQSGIAWLHVDQCADTNRTNHKHSSVIVVFGISKLMISKYQPISYWLFLN